MIYESLPIDKKYAAILADPPWHYKTWSKRGTGRSAEQHYTVMTVSDICALPVGNIAAHDCALFLWATFPNILDALAVI